MNLLVTTLGTSWQIVPELLGITNPEQFDFFAGSAEAAEFRKVHDVRPVDECWIVTTEGQRDLDKLEAFAARWGFKLRVFVCKGVNTFLNQDELEKMRSLIYRAAFNGTYAGKDGRLYLSLSGGRKTMSADMQEAGNLFGCDLMMHVVDKHGLPDGMKDDAFLQKTDGRYANDFTPLVVAEKISSSLVVSADKERLRAEDFTLSLEQFPAGKSLYKIDWAEDCSLATEVRKRKKRSSQLYANFYQSMSREVSDGAKQKGNLFRELYFLHPDRLRKIESYVLGEDRERDIKILRNFPKAELHSHLGGVLLPEEIVAVAKEEADFVPDKNNSAAIEFKKKIDEILLYKNDIPAFRKKIYGDFEGEQFFRIGIDAYQALGEFQGSALLQTKKTIAKTVRIYAEKLKEENVRYLELRCSPQNYTKLGLSLGDVVNCIMDTLDQFAGAFEYRLICIVNREHSLEKIKEIVGDVMELRETNARFKEKFAGVDLAGSESRGDLKELREAFMPFLRECIHVTIHAGETEDVQSIWDAAYHLNAERIGHGLHLLKNENLLRCFADKKICVEMCPSSNDQIVGFRDKAGGADGYPLKKYMSGGLRVSLNTDDCGISGTTLTREFLKAAELCGRLTLWDCIVLVRNSLAGAFCDGATKRRLMFLFEDEILRICDEEF